MGNKISVVLEASGFEKGAALVKGFKDSLAEADGALEKFEVGATVAGAGAIAAASAAAGGVTALAMSATDYALEAGKMADATGLNVEASSRWIEVAGDVGVETATITGAIQKFNLALANGKPTLEAYGIEIATTADGTVDANQSFINAADTIGKIVDPTLRAKAAQELFGKSYGEIAEIIEMGADNVQAALDGVSDAKVIDQGELDSAKELRAAIDSLVDAGQDIAIAFGQGAAPVVADFASAASKAASVVSNLDAVTGGSAGKIAAYGTAGLAAAGGLSIVAGQVLKMRTNLAPMLSRLRTAEGGLTGMGRAARGAGIALGALVALDLAGTIYNEVSDQSGKQERNLQDLTIEIGKLQAGATDAQPAIDSFIDAVSGKASEFHLTNPIKTLGKEINLVSGEGESLSKNIEDIDAAFGSLLDTSPAQAQVLVDALRSQAAAMGEGAYEYEGYIELADRYQERVDLTVGSQEALTESTVESTNGFQLYNEMLETAADGAQAVADANKKIAEGLRDEIEALEENRDAWQGMIDARSEAVDSESGFDHAQNNLLKTFRDLPQAIEDAKGDQLALNDVYYDAADAVMAAADADVEKWRLEKESTGQTLSATEALDIKNRAVLRGIQLANGPEKTMLVDRLARLNGIPDEVVTAMLAEMPDSDVEEVDRRLTELSKTREIALKVNDADSDIDAKTEELENADYATKVAVDAVTVLADAKIKDVEDGPYTATVKVKAVAVGPSPDELPFQPPPGYAAGTVTSGPELAVIGEDGTEAVIPLEKPERIRALMGIPGVGSRIMAALAGGQVSMMANGGVVTRGSVGGGRSVELRGIDFGEALDTVFAGYASMLNATEGLTKAQQDLGAAFEENGQTLDANTEDGQANRDAVSSQWDAVKDLAEAQFDAGASVEDVTGFLRSNVDALRGQLEQLGLSTDAIDEYLGALNATPAAIDAVTDAIREQQAAADIEQQIRMEDYLYSKGLINDQQRLASLRKQLAGQKEWKSDYISTLREIDRIESDAVKASEDRLDDWVQSVVSSFDRADDVVSAASSVASGLGKITEAVTKSGIAPGSDGQSAVVSQLNSIADAAKAAVANGRPLELVMGQVTQDLAALRSAAVAGGAQGGLIDSLITQAGRRPEDIQRYVTALAVQATTQAAPISFPPINIYDARDPEATAVLVRSELDAWSKDFVATVRAGSR